MLRAIARAGRLLPQPGHRRAPESLVGAGRTRARLIVLGSALTLALAGCGSPPEPLPTSPPETFAAASGAPSAPPAYPSGGVPTNPLPTGAGLPAGAGLPTYPLPTYPNYPRPATTPAAPATTGPPPARKCTNGPTGAQVLAVIKGKPGIPDRQFVVQAGPYCAGSWQYSSLGLPGSGTDYDPLLVVTSGKPSALKLVEAGADVCSDKVLNDAPVGIRVWACGS